MGYQYFIEQYYLSGLEYMEIKITNIQNIRWKILDRVWNGDRFIIKYSY